VTPATDGAMCKWKFIIRRVREVCRLATRRVTMRLLVVCLQTWFCTYHQRHLPVGRWAKGGAGVVNFLTGLFIPSLWPFACAESTV
jgi:hypothetical protein